MEVVVWMVSTLCRDAENGRQALTPQGEELA